MRDFYEKIYVYVDRCVCECRVYCEDILYGVQVWKGGSSLA